MNDKEERQTYIKTSRLASIFEGSQLLAEVEDWDYYLLDPPLNPTNTVEIEIEQVESAKPLPYTPWWKEDNE